MSIRGHYVDQMHRQRFNALGAACLVSAAVACSTTRTSPGPDPRAPHTPPTTRTDTRTDTPEPPPSAAPQAPPSQVRADATPDPPEPPSEQPLQVLRGKATYYASSFAGKTTASGEVYDPKEMTAAVKRLPLGSVVQVVRVDTDRAVQVRVNDRLPKRMGASIDLSRAAAEKLNMIEEGIVPVKIEVLSKPAEGAP